MSFNLGVGPVELASTSGGDAHEDVVVKSEGEAANPTRS